MGRTSGLAAWPGLLIGALSLLLVGRPGVASAGEATSEVKATVDGVLSILRDPQYKGPERTAERRDRIRGVVLQRFGFAEMARRSLGTEWAARTPKEREEYVNLFTDLLERSYISRIENYSGEKIIYLGDSVEGDRAEVRSEILSGGDRSSIVYRLTREDSSWQVYDLVIDGVSLVNNYRIQFGQIMRTGGFEELMKKLRSKQISMQEEEHTQSAGPR